MTVGEFAERISSLRGLYPMSVTSWFRTPLRNKAVGGVPNSWHQTGLAVDVVFDEGYELDSDMFRQVCHRLDLLALFSVDHWHIQFNGYRR